MDVLHWLRRRLSPGSYFGLELTGGVLLFLGAAWLFGGVAEDVATGDPLTLWDDRIARWFHAHQDPALTAAMQAVSAVHEWRVLAVPAVAFLGWLAWQRAGAWMVTLLCVLPGGMLLNTGLKLAFHRERPAYSGLAQALHSYSFPSGHVMAATLFWGVLAAYLASRATRWRARAGWVAGAALVVAGVALSRMVLGVHYFSDVVAAAAAGVAWLALCRIAVNTYCHNRGSRGPPGIAGF